MPITDESIIFYMKRFHLLLNAPIERSSLTNRPAQNQKFQAIY